MSNKTIGKIGAVVTGAATLLFAVFMLVELIFGVPTVFFCMLVSMFIALGFLLFMSGTASVCKSSERKAAGIAGLGFAAIYVVLILIVYYSGVTTVNLTPSLGEEARSIIDYSYLGSLYFNYDLLGYGMMALATFFTSFTIEPSSKESRAFRMLMRVHGIFFPSCFVIPMLGIFTGGSAVMGTLILEVWCLYFIPLCVLGYRYFGKQTG